jgi:site-specific recombinase XerC
VWAQRQRLVRLLEQEGDLDAVQRMFGHTSAAMTSVAVPDRGLQKRR